MKTIAMVLLAILITITGYAQTVSTFVGPGINIDDDMIMDAAGNIYGSRYTGSRVYKVTPDGVVSVYAQGIVSPNGLAIDSNGILYVADNQGNKIYKITSDSTKTQYGPNLSSPSGLLFEPDSDTLIVTQLTQNRISKLAPDGTLTVYKSGNGLNGPVGMTMDENGNFYVANYNDGKVFHVTDDSLIQLAVVPGTNFGAVGFLEYAAGNLYATGIAVHRIYKISLSGEMTVFAGTGVAGLVNGPADSARFSNPNGILASPDHDKLYISDFGTKSIRLIDNIVSGVSGATGQLPENFRLEQNYPNPFNPGTTIAYEIPERAAVSLKIYNVMGEEVATLVNGVQQPGRHTVNWNAGSLASGIFFYRIRSGEFVQTKKLTLMR